MLLGSVLRRQLDSLTWHVEKLTEDFGIQQPENEHDNCPQQEQALTLPASPRAKTWQAQRRYASTRLPVLLGRDASLMVGKRIQDEKSEPELLVADASDASQDSQAESEDEFDSFVRSEFANLRDRTPSPASDDFDVGTFDVEKSRGLTMASLEGLETTLAAMQRAMGNPTSKFARKGEQLKNAGAADLLLKQVNRTAAEFRIAQEDFDTEIIESETRALAKLCKFAIDMHAHLGQTSRQHDRRLSNGKTVRFVEERPEERRVRFARGGDNSIARRQKPKQLGRTLDQSLLHDLVLQQNDIAALQRNLQLSRNRLEAYEAAVAHVCNAEAVVPDSIKEVILAAHDEVTRNRLETDPNYALKHEIKELRASVKKFHDYSEKLEIGRPRRPKKSMPCKTYLLGNLQALSLPTPAAVQEVTRLVQTPSGQVEMHALQETLQQVKGMMRSMETERKIFLCSIAQAKEFTSTINYNASRIGKQVALPPIPNLSTDLGLSTCSLDRNPRPNRIVQKVNQTIVQRPLSAHAESLNEIASRTVTISEIDLQKQQLQALEQQHQLLHQELCRLRQIKMGQILQHLACDHELACALDSMALDVDNVIGKQCQANTVPEDSSDINKSSCHEKRMPSKRQNVFASDMDPRMAHLLRLRQENLELIQLMREIDACSRKVVEKRIKGEVVDRDGFGMLLPEVGEEDRAHEENMRAGRKKIRALQGLVREQRSLWTSPKTQDPQFASRAVAAATRLARVGKGSRNTLLRNFLNPKRTVGSIENISQHMLDVVTLPESFRDATKNATAASNRVDRRTDRSIARCDIQTTTAALHADCQGMLPTSMMDTSGVSINGAGRAWRLKSSIANKFKTQGIPNLTFETIRSKLSEVGNVEHVSLSPRFSQRRSRSKEKLGSSPSDVCSANCRSRSKERLALSQARTWRIKREGSPEDMSFCLQGVRVNS